MCWSGQEECHGEGETEAESRKKVSFGAKRSRQRE